jgi:predicted ABC-type ATPase
LYLESPELAVKRVAERVKSGGHAVPERDIRRRYSSGLKNLFQLYRPIADNWSVWNTSIKPHIPIAQQLQESTLEVNDTKTWQTLVEVYANT